MRYRGILVPLGLFALTITVFVIENAQMPTSSDFRHKFKFEVPSASSIPTVEIANAVD